MNTIDYYQLVANMPVAYSLHQMIYNENGKPIDYKFLYVNHYFENFTGLTADHVIGKTCMDLFPETEQYWIDIFEECILKKTTINYENYSEVLKGYYQVTSYSPAPGQFITLTIDVTEQKTATNKLIQSEERYRLTQEVGEIGSWEYCLETKKYWNSVQLRKLFGIDSTEEDVDAIIRTCIIDKTAIDTVLENLIKNNTPYDIDYTIKRQNDGAQRILNSKAQLVVANDCSKTMIRGVVVDITDRRMEQLKISESEANFRSLIESINDMIIIADFDGNIQYVNPIFCKKMEYTLEEVRQMTIFELHPKVTTQEIESFFNLVVNKDESIIDKPIVSFNFIDKNRKQFPVRIRINYGTWNNKESVFGLIEDISSEIESNLRFDMIFRKNSALMGLIDSETKKIVDINDAFLQSFEYKKEEIIGKTALTSGLIYKEDIAEFEKIRKKMFENGHLQNEELRFLTKSGNILTGLISSLFIENNGDKLALVVMIDVSERKFYENKLLENTINTQKVLNISASFIHQKYDAIDFDQITNILLEISGAKYLLMNILNQEYSQTVSFCGENVIIDIVNKYLNINLKNHKWLRKKEFDDIWMQNKVTEFKDLENFTSREMESKTMRFLQKRFKIGQIVMVRIEGFNQVVGNFIFIFDKNTFFVNSELIEMFTYQVGQYIQRTRAETDLHKKMEEMERFHRLTVNRELNMIELKNEVNQLLIKSGESPKYNVPGNYSV